MPAPTSSGSPAARRAFVLDYFRVQGSRTPHGNFRTAKGLIPYCEEVVCEGLYGEVMDAVARQDPALSSIVGVSDEYLLWAIDMTMYYFVISSVKESGIVQHLDATGYFTFQFPKPDKWVLADRAATASTAAFGQWMAQREVTGSKLHLYNAGKETIAGAGVGAGGVCAEKAMRGGPVRAPRAAAAVTKSDVGSGGGDQDGMDDLVGFMKEVVL